MSMIRPIGVLNQSKRMVLKMKPRKFAVPMSDVPLVSYYMGEREARESADVLYFFKMKNIKIPDFLKPHMETKTGFDSASKDKLKKALTDAYYDGKVSEEDYKKYLNKISFTGHGEGVDEFAHTADSASDAVTDTDEGGILDAILDLLDEWL